jgi:4-hydroxybenzoate polyprenyltransferase
VQAFLKLTRWAEYVPFTVPLTLIGGLLAYRFSENVSLDWRLLLVVLANCLAVGYAFIINDIEDAPDDMADPIRGARNAIACGDVSRRAAWTVALVAAILALGLYALAGRSALLLGAGVVVLGHLYSWKPVRLKALPLLDILSHVLMLSTFLLMASYVIYDESPGKVWLFAASMTLISAYGQLYNQVRDFEPDRAAGLLNTASLLGKNLTQILAYVSIGAAVIFLIGAILVDSFPLWLAGVLLVTLPFTHFLGRGRDMRGDETSDAVGGIQVQFLAATNILALVWLAYVVLWG